MRQAALFVALVSSISLIARWPIASHDLEHFIGPDEGEVVENVLEMVKTRDFDHRHRGYPGFHFYLQRIPVEARLLLEGRAVAELPREDFYLGARRMTLLAGVLTAPLVFAAGLHFLTPWGAAVASALVALSPLAFRESAVVNPDLMLGLFVALALLFALRLLEAPGPGRYLAAGVAVGLATAVKYTGVFTAIPFLAALFLAPDRKNRIWTLAGLAAALAAFALGSPYTFLDLGQSLSGVGAHMEFYAASKDNAALEVMKVLGTRGLGPIASLFALSGVILALSSREPRRLLVIAYPLAYVIVFSLFDRAYPRHALALLPSLALLAAGAGERIPFRFLRWAVAFAMLLGPALGSAQLWTRSRAPSPADLAAAWARTEIPEGSRVLEDQWTPSLDPARFRVHRLRVEERVFPGNYDWVFHSGYPPGVDVRALREVRRFENENALGTGISVYQVPDRASLMGTTLEPGELSAEIGAGELRYFGEGFDAPRPGAHGTERLSRGTSSEIFFVLPESEEPPALALEATLAIAVEGREVGVDLELNGGPVGSLHVASPTPSSLEVLVPAERSKRGLNRLVFRYDATARLDRRHRDAAVRFYRVRLTRYSRR